MAEPSILVAGSLHLDVVVRAPRLPALDETLAGQGVDYVFGGKGGNQAVAAAKMGAPVHIAGAVGTDAFAGTLLAELDRAGVEWSRVAAIPGASGMSVAIVDAQGSYGAVIVSAANLAFDPGSIDFPQGCRILMLQNEIAASANLALARRARAAGVFVILNAAPARPADPELLRCVDLLVVNRVEAEQTTGSPASDAEQAARKLAAGGPKSVIVTLGADGLCGVSAGGEGFRQAGHKVSVVSTHGAGDAFLGALAARLLEDDALEEACAFAQKAAALHVSTPIAGRGAITAAQVAAFNR